MKKTLSFHNWESAKQLHHQWKKLSQLKTVLSYLRWECSSSRLSHLPRMGISLEHQGNSRMGHSGKLQQRDTLWVPCTWSQEVALPTSHLILVNQLKQSRSLGTNVLFLTQLYQWTDKCSDCSSLLSASYPFSTWSSKWSPLVLSYWKSSFWDVPHLL